MVCTYKWYQFYNLELIYVLLTFILICLSNTFHLLGKPGITSCILQQFGVGLGFSVVSGALLTKPISCLAFLSAYRPNFVFPDPIVGVQIFATIIWWIFDNLLSDIEMLSYFSDIRYDYPTRDRVILKYLYLNDSAFVISQVNMIAIICIIVESRVALFGNIVFQPYFLGCIFSRVVMPTLGFCLFTKASLFSSKMKKD